MYQEAFLWAQQGFKVRPGDSVPVLGESISQGSLWLKEASPGFGGEQSPVRPPLVLGLPLTSSYKSKSLHRLAGLYMFHRSCLDLFSIQRAVPWRNHELWQRIKGSRSNRNTRYCYQLKVPWGWQKPVITNLIINSLTFIFVVVTMSQLHDSRLKPSTAEAPGTPERTRMHFSGGLHASWSVWFHMQTHGRKPDI